MSELPAAPAPQSIDPATLERFGESVDSLFDEAGRVILGQHQVLRLMMVGVLCQGHVLLEGVPGTAKTLMARVLAHLMGVGFKRIQFTPDLMPTDILGTSIFDFDQREFRLVKGPIFTDFLLADEINRSPAKTQSALLEAMQERRVTIEGHPHQLPDHFIVFATQNPIESEGTYPLPEAQLDRFLLKIKVPYPGEEVEDRVLALHHRGFDGHQLAHVGLNAVSSPERLAELRQVVQQVHVKEELIRYIRQLVRATREASALLFGAGPRAGIALLRCAKAMAAMQGRDFVTPDDIRVIATPALRHRLILHPDMEIEGVTSEQVIASILESVDVPR